MIIALTGGTGLVGRALGKALAEKNYRIHLIARTKPKGLPWPYKLFLQTEAGPPPAAAFPQSEDFSLIHLAGEPVFQWPWTKRKKQRIYSSRALGARDLAEALKKQARKPQFFFSAGAAGIYGEGKDKLLTESSSILNQNLFLQKVCIEWEKEALALSSLCRTVVFRIGAVMSHEKGFFYEHMKWLQRGLWPRLIGGDKNWMSWIALEDLVSMIIWSLENPKSEGVYNASSPQPILLKDFYDIAAEEKSFKGLRIPAPLSLMKWTGGEMAKNLLAGAKVFPEKALSEGFVFKYPDFRSALKAI